VPRGKLKLTGLDEGRFSSTITLYTQARKQAIIQTSSWSPPYGEIPWSDLSRLSDAEMKLLIIDVTNRCHRFLYELFVGARGEAILEALKERDPIPKWYDPESRGPLNMNSA
jgi:hypothetical protein